MNISGTQIPREARDKVKTLDELGAIAENARKAGESTGKSGSFFFFSKDKKFIVKTMF